MKKLKSKRIAILIAVLALWLIPAGLVYASTLTRIADNDPSGSTVTGDGYNRGVGYVQQTGLFYAYGGGSLGSGSYVTQLWAWDDATDTWTSVGLTPLSTGERFGNRTTAATATKLIGVSDALSGCDVVVYDALSDTWDTSAVDPPMGCGFGGAGTVIADTAFWFCGGNNPPLCASINPNLPSGGWTNQSSIVGATNLQFSTLIYDSDNQRIVTWDALEDTFVYEFSTGQWLEITGATFPFAGDADAAIAFFDNRGGVLIGDMHNPSLNSMRVYQLVYNEDDLALSDWVLYETWTHADFSYCDPHCQRFAGDVYTVESEQLQTRFVFGGGLTTSASPSPNATRWWSYEGDPPILPSDLQGTIDTWIFNFLRDFLGMDSPAGQVIVASGFMIILSIFLIMLKVPPLIVVMLNGLLAVSAVLATLFDPAIVLGLIAIGGISILLMLVAGRNGERE